MPAKTTRKKASNGQQADFSATFGALRAILEPYERKDMRVVQDTPDYYCIETRFSVMGRSRVMFAAVRKGKAYVSYHLMPIYMNGPLEQKVSAELKRRKQGKACFNFVKPDEKLFVELAELTRLGFEAFKKLGQTPSIHG